MLPCILDCLTELILYKLLLWKKTTDEQNDVSIAGNAEFNFQIVWRLAFLMLVHSQRWAFTRRENKHAAKRWIKGGTCVEVSDEHDGKILYDSGWIWLAMSVLKSLKECRFQKESHLTRNHLHLQHTGKDFCSQVLPFLGRSFHGNRPPPFCFLVGPSPIHCTTQQPAMGRGNRPRKHRFPRKFRPQIWTLLFSNAKKNGWNSDSAACGRGASFELFVDWGLGNASYTWEIRVYSIVYSFTKTSSGIKLWKHHLEHAFCQIRIGQYTTCAMYIYIYIYHSPFRCVRCWTW